MRTKSYQPSSASEGEWFFDSWCRLCARDKSMSEGIPIDECTDNERCEIIAASMAFSPGDDKYPNEWIDGEHGPCCTAFIRSGDAVQRPCEHTADMFSNEIE